MRLKPKVLVVRMGTRAMVLNNATPPGRAFQEFRPALMMATLARTIRAMRFWVLSMQ